jgi:uncharacterized phage-associated protein
MANIYDTAKWFINRESMVQKKLQKLCYYAKAWSLVFFERPIFDEPFEAWAHGPVNRKIWNTFKTWGYCAIEPNECPGDVSNLSADQADLLERVWDTYGQYDAFQLENITHTEKPWIEARNGFDALAPSDTVISDDSMRDYYRSIYIGEGVGE